MFHKKKICPNTGLLLLRLALGAIFIFHGTQKWALWQAGAGAGMSDNMLMLMKALSIIEPLAGLAVILGIFTCWASVLLALVMIGAIYTKITVMKLGFSTPTGAGWEFDFILLAASLCLMMSGAGKISLDNKCCKEEEALPPSA